MEKLTIGSILKVEDAHTDYSSNSTSDLMSNVLDCVKFEDALTQEINVATKTLDTIERLSSIEGDELKYEDALDLPIMDLVERSTLKTEAAQASDAGKKSLLSKLWDWFLDKLKNIGKLIDNLMAAGKVMMNNSAKAAKELKEKIKGLDTTLSVEVVDPVVGSYMHSLAVFMGTTLQAVDVSKERIEALNSYPKAFSDAIATVNKLEVGYNLNADGEWDDKDFKGIESDLIESWVKISDCLPGHFRRAADKFFTNPEESNFHVAPDTRADVLKLFNRADKGSRNANVYSFSKQGVRAMYVIGSITERFAEFDGKHPFITNVNLNVEKSAVIDKSKDEITVKEIDAVLDTIIDVDFKSLLTGVKAVSKEAAKLNKKDGMKKMDSELKSGGTVNTKAKVIIDARLALIKASKDILNDNLYGCVDLVKYLNGRVDEIKKK